MPGEEGKTRLNAFHHSGMALAGQEMPEMNNKGTEVKTMNGMQISRCFISLPRLRAKKTQASR